MLIVFVSLFLFAAAQQHDGVFVCRCAESRSVEAALHQTLTPVQVGYTCDKNIYQVICLLKCFWILSVYRMRDIADCVSFLLQSAVEPPTEILEYPATKGTTPDMRFNPNSPTSPFPYL